MSSLSDVSVILPSLDPDEKLLATVSQLVAAGFDDIILVNDGSKEENLHYFREAAQRPQVQLLHHPVNRGKGAALKTAFACYLQNRSRKGVVTVDGDGQHHPEDTAQCARRMLETGSIVLGARDFCQEDVPFRSRCGNRITAGVFKLFVGMRITDTQTGLRSIPVSFLKAMCAVEGDRFEYETNMLLAMKENRLPYEEVKIRTVYIEENKSSHFHPVKDSWRIYKLIFGRFFRYALSSLASAGVDEGLYVLLSWALRSILQGFALTAVPTALARLCSSMFNFFVNKRLVFRNNGRIGKAMLRYYLLAVPNAVLQMLLTHGVFLLLGIGPEKPGLRGLLYAGGMVLLFVVSFLVQKRWVFAPRSEESEEEHERV